MKSTMQLAVLAVMLASASAAMTLDASSDKIASSTYSATDASDTNLNAAFKVSESVKAIKDLLEADSVSYTAIQAKYDAELKTMAEDTRAGEPAWNNFTAHYETEGGAKFITDYFEKAIAGDALGFKDANSRKEMIEKTVLDMLGMHLVLSTLWKAQSGNDKALWVTTSTTPTVGTSTSTTYGRAQKRGGNYGTLHPTTNEATVNTVIIKALNAGKAAASGPAMLVQYNVVLHQYKVLYSQATLRYANKIDEALAKSNTDLKDLQSEGQAFYRVIAPWVKEGDAESAALLGDMFNTAKPTSYSASSYNYCAAKAALTKALPAVTQAEMGTYAEVMGTGSWTKSDIVCTNPPVPTGRDGIVTAAGTYTPTSRVGASLAYSEAVKVAQAGIKEPPTAATHEALYNSFVNTGIKGVADVDRTGEPDFDLFVAYFGSKKWLSAKFEKTTGSAANSWVATYSPTEASARAEVQSKMMQDNIAVMAVLSDLYKASKEDNAVFRHALWDNGAAKYMGTVNATGKTVYERAHKRAGNYGTKTSDVANVNLKIVKAFKDGQGQEKSVMVTQLNIIRDQIKVIYAQATLRYANSIAGDLATGAAYAEHRGEGSIFYDGIAPYVKDKDAAGDLLVKAFFDVDSGVTPESFNYWSYCAVKRVMEKFLGTTLAGEMGTLEKTTDSWCNSGVVAAPTALAKISSKAGDYTPATDVGSSMAFSDAVKVVKGTVSDTSATPNVMADKAYVDTGIKGAVNKKRTGEPLWDIYAKFYDSSIWVSELVMKATVGKDTGFTFAASRAEVVEKSVMDAAAVQLIVGDLYMGAQGTTAAHRVYWDRGAAKYLGSADGASSTVYARANKRAKNYGTKDATTSEAKANHAVIVALNAGAASTTVAARTAQYNKILTQIQVIYSQATLRYAHLIDTDIAAGTDHREHQAEGYAFWRVIAPVVGMVADNANGADYIEAIFNPGRMPTGTDHYCRVKIVLDKQMLSAADMGTLEGTLPDCTGKTVPANAKDSPGTPGTTVGSGASLGSSWTFVWAAVFGIALVMM